MSDSSSDENGSEWIFYRKRPEWDDVTPVPQEEGPRPVVSIAYGSKCKKLLSSKILIVRQGLLHDSLLYLFATFFVIDQFEAFVA